MELDATELSERIRARKLPEAVATIATRGGPAVHPALEFRAESVWAPSWSVIEESGRADLVPLWNCGMTTYYSAADGTFVEWSAEADEPWRVFTTFAELVRSLLTDLYEDEVDDDDRRRIARLLLPNRLVRYALRPENRDV